LPDQANVELSLLGQQASWSRETSESWQHLAVVGRQGIADPGSTTVWLYVDGELVTTAQADDSLVVPVAAAIAPGKAWLIGGGEQGGAIADGYRGRIDDVRLFDRALEAGEIREIYGGRSLQLQFEEAPGAMSFTDSLSGEAVGTCVPPSCPARIDTFAGQGLNLGGAHWATIASPRALDVSDGNFTLSAWIRPAAGTSSGTQGLLGRYASPDKVTTTADGQGDKGAAPTLALVNGTDLVFGFGDGAKWWSTTFADAVVPGVWSHVALTYGPMYDANGVYQKEYGANLFVDDEAPILWKPTPGEATLPAAANQIDIGRASNQAWLVIEKVHVNDEGDGPGKAELCVTWDGQQILYQGGIVDGTELTALVERHNLVTNSGVLSMWEEDGGRGCGGTRDDGDDHLGTWVFTTNDESFLTRQYSFGGDSSGYLHLRLENPSTPFRGKLDEVTVVKRALDAADVAELAASATNDLHLRLDDAPGVTSFANAAGVQDATCARPACPTSGVPGRVNRGALFDGGDALEIAAMDESAADASYTMAMWTRPEAGAGVTRTLMARAGGPKLSIGADDRLSFGLGGDERVTSPAQVTGEWQHVAIAVRAVSASCADVELFVDGVSVQQATCVDHAAGSPLSESWTIGNDPDQTGRHFVGRMDEVRVLSEALEAAAVAELVAAAPVLRVRFDAPDGAIEDDTGLGHAVSCGDLGPECGTIKLRGLRCDACDESWPEDEACEPYALLDGERQTMRDAGGAAAWEAIDPSGSFCGEARLEIREESEWTTSDDSVGSWCSVGATGPSQGTCYSIGSLHRCSVDYEVDPLLTEQACPATGVVGQVGLAARFDGEDDMVRVEEGAPGSLGSTAFSIGAWVLPEQRRTGSQQLLRGLPHQASGSSAYGFGISAGSMTIDYYVQSGGQRRLGTSKGELLEDSWNHVMLTHEMRKDGECDLKLYLNGYLDAVTTDAECILPSPAASQLLVGGGSDDAPFVGRMDEVSLYARSLTALEVRDIFDYEGRYVEARDTRRLAVDNGPPHSVLRSYSEVLPYMANRDAVLLIEAVDDASGVSGVELSVDGVWSAAPACEDALGGTTWCPTFSPSGEGVYAMLVRATDFFGQREEPDLDLPYKVHVDARGPEVTAEYADSAVVTADPHPDIANAWQVRLDGAIRDPLIASGNDGSGVDDLSVIVSLENADGDVAGLGRQAAAVRHKPASPVVYPLRPQYCRDEDECTWEVGYVFTEADPSGPYTLTVEASDLVGNHSAMVLGQVVVDAAMPRARVDRANLTTVRPLTAALKLGGVASDRVVPVVVSRTVAAAAAPMTLTCGTTMLLRMDEAALATEADLAWAGEVHRGSICRIEPAAGTDVSAAAEVCGLPVAVDGSGGTLTFVADSGACDVLAPGAGVDGAELAFVPTLPGSPVINEPAEPGLVAHIAFDNARDEGAGLRLEDLSGGGHAATCSPGGCPVIVNGGPFGAAVVMDGVNDHLALADPEGLSRPASDVTLVALVRPSSRTLGDRAVIAAKADEYGLARSPDGALEWMVNGSWVDVDLSLPADRWTHVALAHEAGVTAVYVDGKRVASTSTGAISAAAEHAFTIGGAEGGVSPFDGRVDELLVFDRALAPKEVGRLARGSEPVLVLALDDARVADDVVLADSSGWEHDGTLHLGDASSVDSVVPGMVGRRAMRLAGEPWIEVGSFDAGDEFTLALWLRDDACRSGVVAQARDGAGERFKVECVVGHPDLLRIELAGQYQALSRPTAGGWHHVALVARRIDQNLAQVDLYQDGALASSSDGFGMASDWSADGVWSFGSGDVGYAAKEDGLFDDIRVYPRALSAQEVKALHASAWRPAAVSGASGAGVELVDWEASVPSGLEGSYRLDLRGVEHEARIDTSGRDERSWFGEVDTLEPRLSVSMERLGRTVRYTTVAEDFNIDEHTLRSPCGAGSSTITLRQPYESPWYLALAGQTAGTAKRP
ncbi:MAG: LamG-like jellyroll fold domain-containing protein, partial [Anaerolineae bacterium]